jgi:excisionase family DNA binding protein
VAAHDALDQLRLANEETVLRLSKAVEYRDPETGAHIERLSHFCAMLASRFGLEPDLTRVASRLHDVGKIAVADSILLKPGPLTPEERANMQRHAEIGYRILGGSRSHLLDRAAIIAWSHHERFDGSGYPRGLAGEEIPLIGRIAGVADVFDALITNRVYRAAISFEEAIAMLTAERGRHFDPTVLDAFIADPDEIEAIVARFDEPLQERVIPAEPLESGPMMTLQEAAATIGVTVGQLRRRADAGTIPSVRTEGGHRRFPVGAVKQLAADRRAKTRVRPVEPPSGPLPTLAEGLKVYGPELVAQAAASLYRSQSIGWLASEDAAGAVREWIDALTRASESGKYTGETAAQRRGRGRWPSARNVE